MTEDIEQPKKFHTKRVSNPLNPKYEVQTQSRRHVLVLDDPQEIKPKQLHPVHSRRGSQLDGAFGKGKINWTSNQQKSGEGTIQWGSVANKKYQNQHSPDDEDNILTTHGVKSVKRQDRHEKSDNS